LRFPCFLQHSTTPQQPHDYPIYDYLMTGPIRYQDCQPKGKAKVLFCVIILLTA